jgi:trimeric autotransporter adhesin
MQVALAIIVLTSGEIFSNFTSSETGVRVRSFSPGGFSPFRACIMKGQPNGETKGKINMKLQNLTYILIGIVCFGLLPAAQAVSPPPDGGYPNGNTAEGNNALRDLTTGEFNTAVGLFSLTLNTGGSSNTGVGASTLRNNTTGFENTAVGADALRNNTIGRQNAANGWDALGSNTTGSGNAANGWDALGSNTTGSGNTASGFAALTSNTTGSGNTATGSNALEFNKTGDDNTASGSLALGDNTTGNKNTASGLAALGGNTTGNKNTASGFAALTNNTTGNNNTAVGAGALIFATGDSNIALGVDAGSLLTSGDGNIYIGNLGGEPAESQTIRIGKPKGVLAPERTFIAGINGVAVSGAAVVVSPAGQLGVAPSSARFKKDIKPMDKASQAILGLKPVSFHYQKDIDSAGTSQFGLVAEEVEKLNPDLVVHDKEGKPFTVRYEAVNTMLLNEFLKEHKKNEEQGATITRLEKQVEALTAGLQKVSAQLELSKSAPQTVLNNR